MSAGVFDVTDAEQGADWRLPLQYTDSLGNPIPLAGKLIECEIRTAPISAGGAVVATPTAENINLLTSEFDLFLGYVDTSKITVAGDSATFEYDIFIFDPVAGTRDKMLMGEWVIAAEVTEHV